MKKLFTLIILTGMIFGLQAQNIENQLGADGSFIIKESTGTEIFNFTHDLLNEPELKIGKNIQPIDAVDGYMLQIQNSSIVAPAISFANFSNSNKGPGLIFHKANGPSAAIKVDDVIGFIAFSGLNTGNSFSNYGAQITSTARVVNGFKVGADLQFHTDDGATSLVRMKIQENGDIVMYENLAVLGTTAVTTLTTAGAATITTDLTVEGLFGGDAAAGGDKSVYVNTDGKLVVGAPLSPPNAPQVYQHIEQLENENQELKARLTKLEAIVEELVKK